MTLSAIVMVLKALPYLFRLAYEVWTYMVKISHGRPEQLAIELEAVMRGLNESKTEAERLEAAKRLSRLWGNAS